MRSRLLFVSSAGALLLAARIAAGQPSDAESRKPPQAPAPPAPAIPFVDLEAQKGPQPPASPAGPAPSVDLEAVKPPQQQPPSFPGPPLPDLEAQKRQGLTPQSEAAVEVDPRELSRDAIAAIPLTRGSGARILPFLDIDGGWIGTGARLLAFRIIPASDEKGNVRVVPIETGAPRILPFLTLQSEPLSATSQQIEK